ncbi:hypothetical protein ABTC22_18835, partial [Acinetobacter baumannii]
IKELIAETVENAWMLDENDHRVFDYHVLFEDLNELFPLVDHATVSDLEKHQPGKDITDYVQSVAAEAYEQKRQQVGEDLMKELERRV